MCICIVYDERRTFILVVYMDTDMLNEIADDKDMYADYSVSSGCGAADSNRRLIFDWTDDDLDDEYFYNYGND